MWVKMLTVELLFFSKNSMRDTWKENIKRVFNLLFSFHMRKEIFFNFFLICGKGNYFFEFPFPHVKREEIVFPFPFSTVTLIFVVLSIAFKIQHKNEKWLNELDFKKSRKNWTINVRRNVNRKNDWTNYFVFSILFIF